MIPIALIAAAAAVYFWPALYEASKKVDLGKIERRHAAAAIILAAAVMLGLRSWAPEPSPFVPPDNPPAPRSLVLDGLFRGPTASSDAACIAALCDELADNIEWDGTQSSPLLSTGIAIDDLRRRSREFRCRGESIGERQPVARDEIAKYLESKVGTSGGAVDPDQRAAWVAAFREIGRAASDASQ